MSTGMIIVAVVVFLATRYYMKKQCENEKKKLATDMLYHLMMVDNIDDAEDKDNYAFREVAGHLRDARERSYLTSENKLFNCLGPAAAYRLRGELKRAHQFDLFTTAIKSRILTPEQREQYRALRDEFFPEDN